MARKPFRYADERAAIGRLTCKYGSDIEKDMNLSMDYSEALCSVSMAVEAELGDAGFISKLPADRDDCLAALSVAGQARARVDYAEMVVIDGARAKGTSWADIGVALGHTPDTAEQAARSRWAGLRRRWPGYQPLAASQQRPPTANVITNG